jgi:hypothetical protein
MQQHGVVASGYGLENHCIQNVSDKSASDEQARRLAYMLAENFQDFADDGTDEVRDAGRLIAPS